MDVVEILKLARGVSVFGAVAVIVAAVLAYRQADRKIQLGVLLVSLVALVVVGYAQSALLRNPCAGSPELILNEVCAEGDECGIEDFVEIFNPTDREAELSCYALVDKRGSDAEGKPRWRNLPAPLPVPGTLGPGERRAWWAEELEFELDKDGDGLRLVRLNRIGELGIIAEPIDAVTPISRKASYWYRSPDGGDWLSVPHAQQDAILSIATFNKANPAPPVAAE